MGLEPVERAPRKQRGDGWREWGDDNAAQSPWHHALREANAVRLRHGAQAVVVLVVDPQHRHLDEPEVPADGTRDFDFVIARYDCPRSAGGSPPGIVVGEKGRPAWDARGQTGRKCGVP